MREDLLQFIWRSKTVLDKPLYSTNGLPITVINPGLLNTNQGPDFLFAKIQIDGIIWNGHVEIHIKSSDWDAHRHDNDPNYQNIVLHVVWDHDQDVHFKDRILPCLELNNYVDRHVLDRYDALMNQSSSIACHSFIDGISAQLKTIQLERMMVERLEHKTEKINAELVQNQWDWEELFYKKLAHYLVAPVNSDAMDSLTRIISRRLVLKNCSDLIELQSLFFGVSGFLLCPCQDDYFKILCNNFRHQQLKFELHAMDAFQWKLLRLRPAHFPTLRIAQLTALLYKSPHLFSQILEARDLKSIYVLMDVSPGIYWQDHVGFSKRSKYKNLAAIGKQTKEILIINVVIPFLFAYGRVQQKPSDCQRALDWMQSLKAEKNNIVYMWKSFNFAMDHAGQSQGGIQLYRCYCMEKKCSSCLIGNEILNHPMKHVHRSC